VGHFVEHFLAAAGYAHLGPISNEPLGNRAAYSSTSSGNERYFGI
jgi:hypothetical protein